MPRSARGDGPWDVVLDTATTRVPELRSRMLEGRPMILLQIILFFVGIVTVLTGKRPKRKWWQ